MIPKTEGKDIELMVIQPVYKKEKVTRKNEFGMIVKEEIDKFVKEAYVRVWMDKNDLNPVGYYMGSKGHILTTRALVYNRSTDSYYKVAHSVDEIRSVTSVTRTQIGYKTY